MRRGVKWPHVMVAYALLPVWLAGCESMGKKEPPPEPAPRAARDRAPVLVGTIGAATYFGSATGQPVRGFGVVVGLGDDGSSDCPTFIREHIVEAMARERDTWSSLEDRRRFSPGELIDSPTTAVVEIDALVPPGAAAGTRFDILVRAIPGTATRSLSGGLLLPCELRLADPARSDQDVLAGRVVARAAGPVFVNPFADDDQGGQPSLRQGNVLSGGRTTHGRSLRLLLREPSYPLARRLERRINERFGQRPPVAEAGSRGYLVIEVPRDYAGRRDVFLRLLPHLYLESHPAFSEAKLRELTSLMVLPGADCEGISLAYEGIGRTAVPQIKPLYSHADPRVRFYAARAGLRLRDVEALPALGDLTTVSDHSVALLAIHELGECGYPQATMSLMPLLDSDDHEIRIAACAALLSHPQPAIRSIKFPYALDRMQLNMVLDVVESAGEPLIYVRRSRVPRITVFGSRLPVLVPMFHTDGDDLVTINAIEETDDLTLFAKRRGRVGDPIVVPPRVVDLISVLADLPVRDEAGELRGLGLPYSQVVRILAALCEDGTIPARLEVERPSLTELLGPAPRPERPEADELSDSSDFDFDDERTEVEEAQDEP